MFMLEHIIEHINEHIMEHIYDHINVYGGGAVFASSLPHKKNY